MPLTRERLRRWQRAMLFAEECPQLADRLAHSEGLTQAEGNDIRNGADEIRLVYATSEQGLYRLLLDEGLVRVARAQSGEAFSLTVLNKEGIPVVDTGYVPQHHFGGLVEFFNLVQRSAQEGALESILREVRRKSQAGV